MKPDCLVGQKLGREVWSSQKSLEDIITCEVHDLESQCIQTKRLHISGPKAKAIPLLETSLNKCQMLKLKGTYLKADVL